MSELWEKLINIQDHFIEKFNETGKEIFEPGMDRFNHPGWVNRVWTSENYRRAHVDVVDARNSKGLWMMHCCIFPHIDNPAPIFGYDVVAGKNKITGFFHDYSSTGFPQHPMTAWFSNEVSKLEWRKTRELPEWAKRIFSSNMIAASNVSDATELEQIANIAKTTIAHYLSCVGESNGDCVDNTKGQNFYCENQKLNPHTPKVMVSLGLKEEDVRVFIEECLFPEIR